MIRVLLSTLFSTALTGSVLTAAALLLTLRTRRRLSARWHRAMLCVPLLFYALPAGLVLRTAASVLARRVPVGELPRAVFPEPLQHLQFGTLPAQAPSWQSVYARIPAMLLLIWITGALLALVYRLLQLHRFRKMLQSTSIPVGDAKVLAVWRASCRDLPVRRVPTLWTNPCVGTPLLTGWQRGSALILPGTVLSERELALVFRHELIHARRRDLQLKWTAMLLCCLHWFNPLVYLLDRRLSHWIELACDEEVVRGMNPAQRREYGLAILATFDRPHEDYSGICTALCENTLHMKERLSAMLHNPKSTRQTTLLAILAGVAVAASGLLVGFASQSEAIPQPFPALSKSRLAVELQQSGTRPMEQEPEQEETGNLLAQSDPNQSGMPVGTPGYTTPLSDYGEAPTQLLWPVQDPEIKHAVTYDGHAGLGVDFAARKDSAVLAAADAVVVVAYRGYTDYGHYVILDHGGGYQTLYAHCASIDVEVGDEVKAGEPIATVGRTGWATGNHLHFEVRRNGEYVDPRDYIDPNNAPVEFPQR